MAERGTLYVVATPIGNLEDLSPRAARVLGEVALIAAEDTRHTRKLLAHVGVNTPLISLHEHNERQRIPQLLARLAAGADLALVSDAGTPLVSDPGYRLVHAAAAAGFDITPVPGPCAAVAALSVAGLPSDRFHFVGFLPARIAARRKLLAEAGAWGGTVVAYEAPHRLLDALADIEAVLGGDRPLVLARELTKLHETVWRGPAAELAAALRGAPDRLRGECVLLIGPGPAPPGGAAGADLDAVLAVLLEAVPPSTAAALAARLCGVGKREAYRRALERAPQAAAKPPSGKAR